MVKNYTQIPNDVLEALAARRLPGLLNCLALFVIRETFGYHREFFKTTNRDIAHRLGATEQQISRELRRLGPLGARMLIADPARGISLRPDISKWTDVPTRDELTRVGKHYPTGQTLPGKSNFDKEDKPVCQESQTLPINNVVTKETLKKYKDIKDFVDQEEVDACAPMKPVSKPGTTSSLLRNHFIEAFEKQYGNRPLAMTATDAKAFNATVKRLEKNGMGETEGRELIDWHFSRRKPVNNLKAIFATAWVNEFIASRGAEPRINYDELRAIMEA